MGGFSLKPMYYRASASAGTVTIDGTGFGTKSTVAPFFYPDWTGLAQGDNWADAGWDVMGGTRGNNVTYSQIRTDVTLYGSPVWRTRVEPGVGETFTHFGKNLSAANGVTVMYLRRGDYISNTGGSSGDGQIKSTRIGYSGFTGSGDGGDQYGTRDGQFGSSHFIGNGAIGTSDGSYISEHYWDADVGGGGEQTILTDEEGVTSWPPAGDGNWHWYYDYVEMGTSQGASNAKHYLRVDDVWMVQRSNLPVYNSGGFTYVQPTPGYANAFADNGTTWNWFHAFVYIDTSRAFAALGNASTFAACTRLIPLNLATWSDTRVTGDLNGLSVPSGFDWAYVMTESGSINSSGLSYT
tara:strand:+ start:570 stop:1625 length:1056 start_codon:yes stop_codon:yes gene_type:complete